MKSIEDLITVNNFAILEINDRLNRIEENQKEQEKKINSIINSIRIVGIIPLEESND